MAIKTIKDKKRQKAMHLALTLGQGFDTIGLTFLKGGRLADARDACFRALFEKNCDFKAATRALRGTDTAHSAHIRQSWRLTPFHADFYSMNIANPHPGVNKRCMAIKECDLGFHGTAPWGLTPEMGPTN